MWYLTNNARLSGNSDLSRVAFITVVDEAVRQVCTKEAIAKAFSCTGIIPFDPKKIDLSKYPSSFKKPCNIRESPVKLTCSACRLQDVELHPLVRHGHIPLNVAAAFTYTPPPMKTKSKSKIVRHARVITSDAVRAEVAETEKKKQEQTIIKLSIKNKKRKLGTEKGSNEQPKAKHTRKTTKESCIYISDNDISDNGDSDEDREEKIVQEADADEDRGREGKSGEESNDEDWEDEGNKERHDNNDEDREGQELSFEEVKIPQWIKVNYEGEKFIGRVLEKVNGQFLVRCLEKPFGVYILQDMEKESHAIYYDKVFFTHTVPELKKHGRKFLYTYKL